MVNFCCVPCCSNNSIRDSNLSYFRLPLRNKALLKQWIHSIGRKICLLMQIRVFVVSTFVFSFCISKRPHLDPAIRQRRSSCHRELLLWSLVISSNFFYFITRQLKFINYCFRGKYLYLFFKLCINRSLIIRRYTHTTCLHRRSST